MSNVNLRLKGEPPKEAKGVGMGKDHIGYDELVDNALRSAMRMVLLRVAEEGLRGSHHLYITFRTNYPGVDIPGYLQERYPDELTIVLQHQFWGLDVTEEGFSVTLSFNKAREHLSVPFAALTRFADPGVKFGLQFEAKSPGVGSKLELVGGAGEEVADTVSDGPVEITKIVPATPGALPLSEDDADDEANDTDNAQEITLQDAATGSENEKENGVSDTTSAEVVTLDSFRKK